MASLDWESHKAEIQRLYIDENKKILEVVHEMKFSRNFIARSDWDAVQQSSITYLSIANPHTSES
ncbi:hypothetical protein J3E68DRAFT_408087 [Trichoderma sp. SZMC 28012]